MTFRTVAAVVCALSVLMGARQVPDGEWRWFGRDPGAQRYSPLTQITPDNVARLQQAWSFDTGVTNLQVTPIVVDGLMYLTGGNVVFALEQTLARKFRLAALRGGHEVVQVVE